MLRNSTRTRQTIADGPPARTRRGITTIELTVAVMLLAAVFASLGPMLTWIRQQRRLADDRQYAMLALANAAERLSLQNYDQLTPDLLGSVTLPPEAASELKGASLAATLANETDPTAKRITLALTWQADGVRPVTPLQLVLWRFPTAEAAP